jgi:streptogramin lyase
MITSVTGPPRRPLARWATTPFRASQYLTRELSGTQRPQDGGSIRSRTAGVRLRIPALPVGVRVGGRVLGPLAGRVAVLAGVPVLIAGLAAGAAAAASGGGQVSTCTGPGVSAPFGITSGPDGEQALWFTNDNGVPGSTGGSIGEITTTCGPVNNYGSSQIEDPAGITAGPDGAVWFTNFAWGNGDSIGEITTSGHFTFYTSTLIDGPEAITVGPDGALWFTNTGNNTIGRLDPASEAVTSYSGAGIDDPTSITAGPDWEQALWFTNNQNNSIGRITTSGAVANYTGNSPSDQYGSGISGPTGITAGPDDDLWYSNVDGGPYGTGSIGQMTTAGQVVNVTYDPSILNPAAITVGPDGALWFTNNGNGLGSTIGRITPPAPQTITFTSTPPSPAVYGGSYPPQATGGGSGNPVTFSIDPASTAKACSISSSGVVSFTGLGTCVIDASQAGDSDYTAAPEAQQSFTIGQAPQSITFTSIPPASPAFGSTYAVSATGGGSGQPVTFSIDPDGFGPCVIGESTVTFIAPGSCIIDASQAGNADYQAGSARQVITVPPEAPVLTWLRPADIVHGVPLSGTQLDARANVPGTFTYSPAAGTILSLGTHTLTATFTPASTTYYTSGTVSTQITVVNPSVPPCPTCNK